MTSFVAALVTAALLTPLVTVAARRATLLDRPNERSLHDVPTPRGGGVAVGSAAVVGVVLAHDLSGGVGSIVAAASILGVVGLVDDRFGLPPLPRLLAQLVVPFAAVILLADLSPLWACVGALVVAVFVNAFNFMDGINGISALQAAVLGTFLSLLSTQGSPLALAGWAIAGASLGFLPFNAVRAWIFLGDVGSYFMGAWLSVLALLTVAAGVGALVVLGPFTLYLADTGSVLLKRARRGASLFEAHREHTYQRLVQVGWPHQAVAMLTTLATVLNAVVMLSVEARPPSMQVLGFCGCLIVAATYLLLPSFIFTVTQKSGAS